MLITTYLETMQTSTFTRSITHSTQVLEYNIQYSQYFKILQILQYRFWSCSMLILQESCSKYYLPPWSTSILVWHTAVSGILLYQYIFPKPAFKTTSPGSKDAPKKEVFLFLLLKSTKPGNKSTFFPGTRYKHKAYTDTNCFQRVVTQSHISAIPDVFIHKDSSNNLYQTGI